MDYDANRKCKYSDICSCGRFTSVEKTKESTIKIGEVKRIKIKEIKLELI